ncbi:MAG: YegP family protein [Chitinophagales bacterium]|nr:YegP family protein [Chitinophagales bacterium]
MGKFVIKTRTNGEYQFNLQAGNGQNILASEGYTTKTACLNGIESVKKNSPEDARYERKTSSNGKWYFNLKATNGQVIGTSEMYESEAGRENGIESVKKNAPDATVEDTTA